MNSAPYVSILMFVFIVFELGTCSYEPTTTCYRRSIPLHWMRLRGLFNKNCTWWWNFQKGMEGITASEVEGKGGIETGFNGVLFFGIWPASQGKHPWRT